jgi:hypothetical protein
MPRLARSIRVWMCKRALFRTLAHPHRSATHEARPINDATDAVVAHLESARDETLAWEAVSRSTDVDG